MTIRKNLKVQLVVVVHTNLFRFGGLGIKNEKKIRKSLWEIESCLSSLGMGFVNIEADKQEDCF